MPIEDNNGRFHGDDDGKFVSKDGSQKTYGDEYDKRIAEAITEYKKAREDILLEKRKNKNKDEFFGEEFKGFKGKDAIEKLLKEKRGHIKNAFERPEIGGIDLVWGDESGGLGHTIMRRDDQLQAGTGRTSGIDIARKIPEIIEKGKFSLGAGDRPNFTYNDYLVVVRPAFDGEKVNWVVTAMEPQK
ncbi:MAG: hypothetical protein K2L42_03240 [Clostridia bacterium]|nr:hypothetical protein [Clostridia bacterium]